MSCLALCEDLVTIPSARSVTLDPLTDRPLGLRAGRCWHQSPQGEAQVISEHLRGLALRALGIAKGKALAVQEIPMAPLGVRDKDLRPLPRRTSKQNKSLSSCYDYLTIVVNEHVT